MGAGKKMMLSAKPTITLAVTDTEVTTTYVNMNRSLTHKIGAESEHELPNGNKVMGMCTLEGNKLVSKVTGEKGITHTVTREVKGGKLVLTLQVADTTATRTFTKA